MTQLDTRGTFQRVELFPARAADSNQAPLKFRRCQQYTYAGGRNIDTSALWTSLENTYTYTDTGLVPNKTLYVKDADVPLFEQAQEQLGDSVSSMFAEFLRDRVANLTPEEGRIIALLNQIRDNRETAKKDRGLPQFIDSEYAEAEKYADKALKSFTRGDIRKTKVFFYAANTYRDKAERDVKDAKELGEKMAEMLKHRK